MAALVHLLRATAGPSIAGTCHFLGHTWEPSCTRAIAGMAPRGIWEVFKMNASLHLVSGREERGTFVLSGRAKLCRDARTCTRASAKQRLLNLRASRRVFPQARLYRRTRAFAGLAPPISHRAPPTTSLREGHAPLSPASCGGGAQHRRYLPLARSHLARVLPPRGRGGIHFRARGLVQDLRSPLSGAWAAREQGGGICSMRGRTATGHADTAS